MPVRFRLGAQNNLNNAKWDHSGPIFALNHQFQYHNVMGLYKPKRVMEAPDIGYGVCLWRFDDGSYLMDDNMNHFAAQGVPFDPEVEKKMTSAVLTMGIEKGKPFWLPGFRKITNSEWEDQMAALQDGEIPDAVDAYNQTIYGN